MTALIEAPAMLPVDWALAYARIGWHVFPIKPGTKQPIGSLTPNGYKNATTDGAIVRAWWDEVPDAGIGIAVQASGLVVVDVDPRNGGHFDLERIEAERGQLATDVEAFTGGGGQHLVFLAPADIGKLPGRLAKGIDLKADGYIVVEPSLHPSGRRYEWEASSNPLDGCVPSPLPGWIADMARGVALDAGGGLPRADTGPAPRALSAQELADVEGALAFVPAGERETWLTVGMALHKDVGGALGYEMWCAWSKTCPQKFDPQDQQRVWRSFTRKPMGEAVQLGTVFDLAYKHGFSRAQIVVDPAQLDDGQVSAPPAPIDTPDELLTVPGVLGLAVQWINATARKPQPLFAVQAALALGSAVLGRRFRTDNGNWSALYFLNVGASGAGKEHAKYAVERALEAAGLDHLLGSGRFASESGVLSSLVEKPAQFSVLDEFGKTLQSAAHAQNFVDRNTLKFLMEVWGRADGTLRPVAYSTAGLSSKQAEELARRFVRKPSLTMLAMSTPETLFGGLTTAAVADGFLNRFLTVHSDTGRQLSRPVRDLEPPDELVQWLQAVASATPEGGGNLAGMRAPHDMEPQAVVLTIDPGALAVFADFELAMHQRMGELDAEGLAEMMTRATEMAMRLALIVAVSWGHDQVLRQDARWACSYVLHHRERDLQQLREKLSDGPFDALCKEVLRVVCKGTRKGPGYGMTESDICAASRQFRSVQNAKLQEDVLRTLERRNQLVRVAPVDSTGKKLSKSLRWMDARLLADGGDA